MAKLRSNTGGKAVSKTTLTLGNLAGKAEGQSCRHWSKTTTRLGNLDGKAERQRWWQSWEHNYLEAGEFGWQR